MSTHDDEQRELHSGGLPGWLPAHLRAWAEQHDQELAAVVDAFLTNGDWPDPVQLQRELRAGSGPAAVARVVTAMPPELGWREYDPPRLVLSIFGLACSPQARPLLDAYFALLQLALERHSTPASPNRLSRADAEALIVDADLTVVLSRVVLRDCPFLAGGDASLEGWDLEIGERVVDYDAATSTDEFLALVAAERRLGGDPAGWRHADETPPPPAGRPPPEQQSSGSYDGSDQPGRNARTLEVFATVTAIGGIFLAVAEAPLPLAVAVTAACLAAVGVVWWRPHFSAAALAAAILVVALVGAGVGWLANGSDNDTPPIAEQLDEVIARAGNEGQYPALRREGRFRAGVEKSYLFVLRDQEARPGGIPREFESPPSDEIRLYDEIDDRLRIAIRFHPQNFGELEQGPDGDAPGFQFRLVDIVDVDNNGINELLGSFDRLSFASGPFPVPVLVSWDDESSRYRLEPLFDQRPGLRLPPGMPPEALAGYNEPTVIQNQVGSSVLRGYPADVVAVRQASRGPVVLAGYQEPSPVGFNGRFEVKGWFLNLDGPSIELTECTHARHVYATPRIPGEAAEAMTKALIRSPDRPGCGQA